MFEKGLFIFHRDFRLKDNVGLNAALSSCKHLYCCFIFTPEQVTGRNDYKSNNAVQFMIRSLAELAHEINREGGKLELFYGNHKDMIRQFIEKAGIEVVHFNKDYTPYAVARDTETEELCKSLNVKCFMHSDYYLYEPGTIKTIGGDAFKKYTPFYNAVINKPVEKPAPFQPLKNLSKYSGNLSYRITISEAFDKFTKENPDILVIGGRTAGVERLQMALKNQHDYLKMRDMLTYETTFLSAYIKFGCVSVREVYHAVKNKFGRSSGIIRELIWREFFAHVLYAYPEVVGKSYNKKFQKIKWRNSPHDFELWKTGRTGFPIVDAGMRQLNQTGYMHNRVRMMVASFLIKVLLLDWRLGEKYFAQKLTDYDIASNNGNWQGISGTGVDNKPYFRDMNPWIQSAKFDPECEYIKKWIPELRDVDPDDIHDWDSEWEKHAKKCTYPKPMVDYYEQKQKMLKMYREAL